jgi:mono/diheme cytochrome c family protein
MTVNWWATLLVAALAAIAGVGYFFVANAPRGETQFAKGRLLYAERCAACHGVNLEGQPDWKKRKADGKLPAPPHDESGHTWHHSDKQLFTITKFGLKAIAPDYESDMPAFETVLTDDEITAILDYIKSMWPERPRRYQEAQSKADAAT